MKSTTINSLSNSFIHRPVWGLTICEENVQKLRGTTEAHHWQSLESNCNFQTVKLMPAERIGCSPEITKENIESWGKALTYRERTYAAATHNCRHSTLF